MPRCGVPLGLKVVEQGQERGGEVRVGLEGVLEGGDGGLGEGRW